MEFIADHQNVQNAKQEIRALGSLPDKALFKDHAPYKSDQRKVSESISASDVY